MLQMNEPWGEVTERHTVSVTCIKQLQQSKSRDMKYERWPPGAGGDRIGELVFNECRASVWEDEKSFRDGCWWGLYTIMNVFDATEPCT